MKYCTKCGAPNGDDAAFCSKCGAAFAAPAGAALPSEPRTLEQAPPLHESQAAPVKKSNRNGCLSAIFIAAILFAIGRCASYQSDGNNQATVAPTDAPTDAPVSDNDATPSDQSLANGSTIGGLKYTITNVSRQASVTSFGEEKDASGEFLVVYLTVSNVGTKGADISNADFHLERDGAEFDSDTNLTIDGEFFLEKLNPGTTKSGVVVFDVPANTSPTKYSLKVFGNGAEGSQDAALITL